MNPKPASTSPRLSAAGNYQAVCIAALVIIFLLLFRRGFGGWGILPVLIGLLGVLTNWSWAPPVLLGTLTVMVYANLPHPPQIPRDQHARFITISDGILCMAVLAFTAAQYRLLSLKVSIFPTDETAGKGSNGPPVENSPQALPDGPRDEKLVGGSEFVLLLIALPVFALLAQLCWLYFPRSNRAVQFGLEAVRMQAIAIVWTLAIGFFLVSGMLAIMGDSRMSRREAMRRVHDDLWLETRREQGRIGRWINWRRRMRRPKEET